MDSAFKPLSIPLTLRPMQPQDLDAVMALEEVCFPTPWSRETYAHEISANPYGVYWVMAPTGPGPATPPLLAYGGVWVIGDVAHITTLASHPDWRRRGLAGRLLIHLLEVAKGRGATSATLEVRMHNQAAIQLYQRLGFEEVGIRKGYYPDTGEDARLLTLFELDSPATSVRLERERAKFEALQK
jgi:[ribosomal protein S18]-alanine N-acetyltransferase